MKDKKKIIDERGFLFGKVSVVDVLALLLVVALGLMVLIRFLPKASSGPDDPASGDDIASAAKMKVEYVVKVSPASKWHLNTMEPGDLIYNGDGGVLLGTVKDIRWEPAMAMVTMDNGTVTYFPMEDYYDLYVTLETECSAGAGGYYLGKLELNLNVTVQLTSLYDSVSGTVYSIN